MRIPRAAFVPFCQASVVLSYSPPLPNWIQIRLNCIYPQLMFGPSRFDEAEAGVELAFGRECIDENVQFGLAAPQRTRADIASLSR